MMESEQAGLVAKLKEYLRVLDEPKQKLFFAALGKKDTLM